MPLLNTSGWKHNWQAEAGGIFTLLSLFLTIQQIILVEAGDGPKPREAYLPMFVPALLFSLLHLYGRFIRK